MSWPWTGEPHIPAGLSDEEGERLGREQARAYHRGHLDQHAAAVTSPPDTTSGRAGR